MGAIGRQHAYGMAVPPANEDAAPWRCGHTGVVCHAYVIQPPSATMAATGGLLPLTGVNHRTQRVDDSAEQAIFCLLVPR
jgi:hypothetical protein